jgi:cysteine desulfuration protein SufE
MQLRRFKKSMVELENISQAQQEIVDEFQVFEGDKEQSIEYIMDLGMEMEELEQTLKKDEFLIRGCQSKVWLVANRDKDGKIFYRSDSNTAITKGLISLLLRVYSGNPAETIVDTEPWFLNEIGMDQLVGTQRSNGLTAMIRRIKDYAKSFQNVN